MITCYRYVDSVVWQYTSSGCAEMGSLREHITPGGTEQPSHIAVDNIPVHLGNYLVRYGNYLVTCSLLSANGLLLQRLSSYSLHIT